MTYPIQPNASFCRRWRHGFFPLLLVVLFICLPGRGAAEVDWEISGAIKLEAAPLDVSYSQEADLTYLLTDQNRVLIYDAAGELVGTVPVDAAVTDIAVSAKGEKLYLINGERKTLQIVDISFVSDINVADSPFLGPPGAEVTVVVFSDFQ